eukprot:1903895-Rhodomonas_salina.1
MDRCRYVYWINGYNWPEPWVPVHHRSLQMHAGHAVSTETGMPVSPCSPSGRLDVHHHSAMSGEGLFW